MFFDLTSPAWASLPQGNAVKDPTAILRDALPFEQDDIRQLQHRLELTSDDLRAKRWSALGRTVSRGQALLSTRRKTILDAIPEPLREQADMRLSEVGSGLEQMAARVKATDKPGFIIDRRVTLHQIGEVESLLVKDGFERIIPSEFDSLPRLQGRAKLKISTTKGELTTVVDGYNAPLTSGAFVDLALKGFYDGLPFTRAEDFYVLQSGDPEGPEIGYIDPSTKQERYIPLEIRIPEKAETLYNETFEDVGFFKATPTLPFATLGTLGWAHSDNALDDGSSQFFIFLYEPELTPAGLNLVDGRNAAFGYVIEGFDVLKELGVDDKIITVTLIDEIGGQLKSRA
ncbi:peptidylprolyl isomerase [Synechococcus sp. M16CYN]